MIKKCKDCGIPLLYECLWPDGQVRCSKCHNKKVKKLDKEIAKKRKLDETKVPTMWM